MEFAIRQTVDLGCENPVLHYAQPLEYGDSCAHRWIVTVERDGAAADLSAMSAKCYVTRAAGDAERAQGVTSVTLPLETAIDAQGGTISCVFQEGCYGGVGAFAAIMRLSDASGATVTAAKLTARLDRSTSDAVYDPEGLVPSLDALLAQIETIEAATEAANAAADNANAKAAAANAATANATTATGIANAGAENANKAAAKINGLTISATGLEAGSAPTAALSEVDGHYHIALAIPRGDTGATPQISVEVATSEPGSEAQVSVSGTAENPVIHLTVPRGDTGAIDSLPLSDGAPASLGVASAGTSESISRADHVHPMPGAEAIGALGKNDTASDSSKFEGKTLAEIMLAIYPVGAIYMSTVSASPASLFGGTWEEIQDTFLLAAGSNYAAGSTGGEKTHTLTEDEMPSHHHKMFLPGTDIIGGSGITYINSGSYTANPDTYKESANRWSIKVGRGLAHNNMPPYLAVYVWKRVA